MEETKYYCDECGVELNTHRCLTVRIAVTEGYRNSYHDRTDVLTHGKEVYNYVLCPICVGEIITWGHDGEGSRTLSLSEYGRSILVRLGLLKPKLNRLT